METFRDTCFGKLVRLFSGQRLFRYPEEKDKSAIDGYLKKEQVVEKEDGEKAIEDPDRDPEWGLYSLMSQATRASGAEAAADGKSSDKPTRVIGWNGSADSENPQNWSTTKKLLVSSQIWVLTFCIYIGSAIYTPAISGVTESFGVSTVAATIGLTLFVLGYGIGPMIFSPLSEVPMVGRSPTFGLTLLVFFCFQFAVIYATNFGMLMAFRFLTGFFGSPALATGGAAMGDMWGPVARDYMIGIWAVFAVSAPVLGPLVGGYAFMAKGWTWPMWELLWAAGFSLVLLFFCLPETFAPNILTRRARRVRRILGEPHYMCEAEVEIANVSPMILMKESLLRPFQLCFGEPIVCLMNIHISLIYGILYIFFEAFPIVFGEKHGFNLGEVGLSFLGILVGAVAIGTPLYFIWKWKYQSKHFDKDFNMAPEHQLPSACVGAVCLPISLFWFGWTGQYESVHWIVPIMASALFSIGAVLIFNSIFAYQASAYPKYSASVLAGNDLMRSSFAAGFPLFATAMFHNLGVNWASTLLGCLTLVFAPYPWILYRYGKRLRLKSKFARHDI